MATFLAAAFTPRGKRKAESHLPKVCFGRDDCIKFQMQIEEYKLQNADLQ
jgi:hypothetical protein